MHDGVNTNEVKLVRVRRFSSRALVEFHLLRCNRANTHVFETGFQLCPKTSKIDHSK